jgi:hypothetical protein
MREESTPGGESSTAFSRRRVLGLSVAAGLSAGVLGSSAGCAAPRGEFGPAVGQAAGAGRRVSAPPPDGVLGANFNGDPRVMTFPELEDVRASWVRGFLAMPELDHRGPARTPAVKALLDAAGLGYGTVLSLKFPYFTKPLPAPGSPGAEAELRRLERVLRAVMGKVDILVIGNEPFIESRAEDHRGPLNAFYEMLATRAVQYRDRNPSKTQLYMGSLNHLDQPSWRTPATERWMEFVRNTPQITGTDIHPHLPDPAADHFYLDYVLPRLRPDQKFLATELSLVLLYKKHLKDPIAPEFADRYHLQRGTPVWQVIKQALTNPFPQQQWDDFLSMNAWFAVHDEYLTNQVDRFRRTGKLAVATYGIGQDAAMSGDGFGPDSTPWLLNSVFCQHTVQPGQDGLPGRNRVWADQFRALQGG